MFSFLIIEKGIFLSQCANQFFIDDDVHYENNQEKTGNAVFLHIPPELLGF